MPPGAPKGNKNAAKAKMWETALRHELAKDRMRLYRVAAKVLSAAEAGEQWAVTEVRNTLDGKPTERLEIEQQIKFNAGDRDSVLARARQALKRIEGRALRSSPGDLGSDRQERH